jgi:hypothetical protein
MKKVGYSTVDEILNDILKTCPFALQEAAKKMTADEFIGSQHFNLGMTIRNRYFYQNPAREQLIVNLGMATAFPSLDGDDFSHIILEKLYERITKKKEK